MGVESWVVAADLNHRRGRWTFPRDGWLRGGPVVIAGRNVGDRELDTVFARNDRGKYDVPAPTVRRAQDDLNGLHCILRNHIEDLSQTQREIIQETYFEGQSRDEIAARRGIGRNTYDNHRKAACQRLRDAMMAVVDFCNDKDFPD